MCSLEGGHTLEGGAVKRHLKDMFTKMHRNNEKHLHKAKINFLLMKLCIWGMMTHHDLPC